jgi:RNA polymerase sigma-70 factor (ECF subfamily)
VILRADRSAARLTEAQSFGELFERHSRAVFAYCARRTADLALADDLTSVVFLEAWRHRDRTQIASSPNALPWLLGVANNVTRNAHRSLRRHRSALSRLVVLPDTHDTANEAVDRADAEHSLRAALSAIEGLSVGERDVVMLVLWSDLSYEETASALGLRLGTVRSRLSRARTKLRASLDGASFTSSPITTSPITTSPITSSPITSSTAKEPS